MKVLMLLENEFPFDERVEKEALLLLTEGIQVHIACFTRKDRPPEEIYKKIIIHRLTITNFQYKASAACLVFPLYFYQWEQFIKALNQQHRFDIFHVHDLPLSKPAYKISDKAGKKLVCDQHEYYSDWIIQTSHYNRSITGRIVKLFSHWKRYERKYLRKADLVITVEEPLREIYINNIGILPEKVLTLPNTPLRSFFREQSLQEDIVNNLASHFTLLYIGGIDILRGIDYVIKAVPTLKETIKTIKLVIIGPVYHGYDPIKSAENLGISDYVEHIPWISLSEIPSYIAGSSVCFFTPPAQSYVINHTIATKIYQYIAMGKPVIVSRALMMKEFVEKNNIGISVDETKPEEFVEAVLKIYNNPEFKRQLSENALKVSENYFWENTSKSFVKAYKAFN